MSATSLEVESKTKRNERLKGTTKPPRSFVFSKEVLLPGFRSSPKAQHGVFLRGVERGGSMASWGRGGVGDAAEGSGWGQDQARSEVISIRKTLRSSPSKQWESQAGIQLG